MSSQRVNSIVDRIPLARMAFQWARKQFRYCLFIRDFWRFRKSSETSHRFRLTWAERRPVLNEATAGTGFDRHYVYHTAWGARVLAVAKPDYHVDISSSLYFAGIVSAFLPVRFYDFRPADLHLTNLSSEAADLTRLPFSDRSIHSLSCMHVVEHIGLGRYGDPIDSEGDIKAMAELMRVVAPGGSLLFVVPIGKPVIQYNAHRVYSYEQIIESFSELRLEQFALIPETGIRGGLIENASKEAADAEDYGCGCFWFKRP